MEIFYKSKNIDILPCMVEIELKARVADPQALVQNLECWADFKRCCLKSDVYWGDTRRQVQLRVRRERLLFTLSEVFGTEEWLWPFWGASGMGDREILRPLVRGPHGTEKVFATYKKKQLVKDSCEVNQEQEFQVEKAEPLEVFLQDAGFSVVLQKEKLSAVWKWGNCSIELCRIPELGDFLELEILCESDSPAAVASAHRKLRQVLAESGIHEDSIESRYYSQLLQEARNSKSL